LSGRNHLPVEPLWEEPPLRGIPGGSSGVNTSQGGPLRGTHALASGVSDSESETLRLALVRALLRDGTLHAGAVEQAFRRVPRHVFLPDVPLDIVYRDSRVPTKLQGG